LLDAVAVLKARVKTIDSRISYGVLERLFKGHKSSVLRSRSLVLLKKPEESAYHDRLVECWLKVYDERKKAGDENLDDPNDKSMTDFDIASFIRCLRQNVDKRALYVSTPSRSLFWAIKLIAPFLSVA
jgi:transcription factor C subunit 3